MKITYIKLIVIALFVFPLLLAGGFRTNTTEVLASVSGDDATIASYKKNCAMCHGPVAAKFYDPEMPMEEQVDAILKGKKAAKPPHMPGYESKGMTVEQATALAEYMKKLRIPAEPVKQ